MTAKATALAWNVGLEALVPTPLEDIRVIWSDYHQMFWRNRCAGYTARLEYAGLYTPATWTDRSRDKMLTLEEAWSKFHGPERDERVAVDMAGTLLHRDREAALCWHAVKAFFHIAEVEDGNGTLALFAENPELSGRLSEPVQEMQAALLLLDERTVDEDGDPIAPGALPTVEDVLVRRGRYTVHEQSPWLETER
jgi:hypothetical protein